MPLDPVLAQGVTPINFAGPDPATKMNQLAMMMKMQGLQQEGQLNALKLTETQREMADVEAMREAIRGGADFRDPKVGARFGAKGAAMSKALLDADSADLDRKTKIAVAGRDIWLGINNQATYEAKLPELEALSPGSTRNLPRMFTPELKAENLMDAKAFLDQYKPTDYERTVTAAGYPKGSPEYTRLMRQKANLDSTRAPTEADRPSVNVRDALWYANATDEQKKAFNAMRQGGESAPSGWQRASDGGLEPIPRGPADPETIKKQAEARRNSELKPLPAPIAKAALENAQNLRKARDALALMQGGKVGQRQGDPNATGYKGFLPDVVLQRMDPAGVDTRAAIADLGSMIIHDRSGAAVTASEYPRLVPFIPRDRDDPPVIKKKLQRFIEEYEAIQQDYTDMYSENQGYKLPKSLAGGGGGDAGNGVGGGNENPPPTEEDIAYTAKKYGMSKDEVRRQLGVQ